MSQAEQIKKNKEAAYALSCDFFDHSDTNEKAAPVKAIATASSHIDPKPDQTQSQHNPVNKIETPKQQQQLPQTRNQEDSSSASRSSTLTASASSSASPVTEPATTPNKNATASNKFEVPIDSPPSYAEDQKRQVKEKIHAKMLKEDEKKDQSENKEKTTHRFPGGNPSFSLFG